MSSEKAISRTAEVISKYPARFMFGTDNVAPDKQEKQLNVYHIYDPLWKAIGEETTYKVTKGNYENYLMMLKSSLGRRNVNENELFRFTKK
jgi:hypothetical protein